MQIANCEFPDDLWYHVEHQVWARPQADGSVVVGITALGLKLAGDLYMCRPKGVGSLVEQGRGVAVVELAKAIVSVKSPVAGTVLEVNARLAGDPQLVQRDPYGDGWLVRIAPRDWAGDTVALVHGDAVAPAMRHHAWLHQLE